jgi:hypothetical protein
MVCYAATGTRQRRAPGCLTSPGLAPLFSEDRGSDRPCLP